MIVFNPNENLFSNGPDKSVSRLLETHKELANLSFQKEKGWWNLLENQGVEKKH